LTNFKEITTVIFDLDGTLRHHKPTYENEIFKIAQNYGLPNDINILKDVYRWAHYYWAQSEELLSDHALHNEFIDLFREKYVKRVLKKMGVIDDLIEESSEKVLKHLYDGFVSEDYIPDDIIPTLNAIRTAGYKTGLVTNRRRPIDEYLEAIGIKDLLDFYYTAGELDTWKPDPKVFAPTFEITKAKPHELLYVGDNPFADVQGAKNAGLIPVLIDHRDLFPDTDCSIIYNIADLLPLLGI
jgi:putative hydrolase of the HAD superfamily